MFPARATNRAILPVLWRDPLMLDAIDLLLKREGEGAVTRWETRRKARMEG
jgi:hypothetical protein